MSKIGVVYFSGTGTTAALAAEVISGIEDSGSIALDLPILGDDIKDGRWQNEQLAAQLDECDGVIFGSPTYMGSTAAQMKAFMDAMAPRWFTQAWRDKIASAFTTSSLPAGDKYNCLIDLTTFAMQMGMVWVGTGENFSAGVNSNGFYFGAGATASNPDQLGDVDKATGKHLGTRVAALCERLG